MSVTPTELSKFGRRRLTARLVSEKYGICGETVNRWTKAGIPAAAVLDQRICFWDEAELETRDRERAPMTRAERAANLTSKNTPETAISEDVA